MDLVLKGSLADTINGAPNFKKTTLLPGLIIHAIPFENHLYYQLQQVQDFEQENGGYVKRVLWPGMETGIGNDKTPFGIIEGKVRIR